MYVRPGEREFRFHIDERIIIVLFVQRVLRICVLILLDTQQVGKKARKHIVEELTLQFYN